MGEKRCSRREFVTSAAQGLGAAAIVAATGGLAMAQQPAAGAAAQPAAAGDPPALPGGAPAAWLNEPGKIIAVHHADAMENMANPRGEIVGEMVDRGVMELAGKTDLASAWSRFVCPADVVEIKINTLGKRHNSTNGETVMAIQRGLMAAGVKPENIFIYDLYGSHMRSSGYKMFRPDDKQVGYGESWGFEKQPTQHGAGKSSFANILGRVTAVINVPVMKDHSQTLITGAMKNMTHGHVSNPGSYHATGGPGIPKIYAHPKIRDKVRLTIMDGLRLLYNGGPQDNPKHKIIHNTIYVTTDPVAMDTLLFDRIQEQRAKAKLRPLKLPEQLTVGEELGLGVHDRSKIKIVPIELKA